MKTLGSRFLAKPNLALRDNIQDSSEKHTAQAGFTLFELIIFLLIIVVLITSILAIVTDIFRSQRTGDRQEVIQSAMISLANDLTQEIQWGESAILTEMGVADSLEVVKEEDPGVLIRTIYRVEDGVLLKNEKTLLSSNVRVTNFDIENLQEEGTLSLLRIRIGLEMAIGNPERIEKVIVVSMRNQIVL